MGALSGVGTALGSAFGTGGTAAEMARASMGWGAAATGLAASSSILQGLAGMHQADYAAKVAKQNEARAAREGGIAESALKGKYTAFEAEQKVAQAANGIEVDSGSAQRVREATADIGAMDAALLHYKTASEVFNYAQEAKLDRAAGRAYAGRGLAGASASLLTGGASLADKWATYRNLGVI